MAHIRVCKYTCRLVYVFINQSRMNMKRVVITGIGAVTPLGNDAHSTWEAMKAGQSGCHTITAFDASVCKTQIAGEVRGFDIEEMVGKKDLRKIDRYAQFALYTADQALHDASVELENENKERLGVIWGSGMGGILTIEEEISAFGRQGNTIPHFTPFYILKGISSIAAGLVSIQYGLKGPSFTTTSACASSAHAVAEAFNYIRLGKADIILTGGSDADITYSGIGGFNSMHALSTRNDSPETASRPFSKSRDGFVLGEGGACLVLEEYEHAKARGAKIYAEIAGTGVNADAYHITAPDPEGNGAGKVMMLAMEEAGITPQDVDYINAHGTSTPLGDIAELRAIERVWGKDAERLNISSTKSMTGHLVGAAGAVEAMATVMALHDGIVPPTINHEEGDEDEQINYRLNFTFNQAQKRDMRYALSNAFGFGGHNVSLLFKKYTE